jgi:hypothetical protein
VVNRSYLNLILECHVELTPCIVRYLVSGFQY